MDYKFGFIGCGNMGSALIKGAIKSVSPSQIYITDKDENKLTSVANETNTIATDIKTIANDCDFIFLGVKPQMMEDMLSEIKDVFASRKSRFVLVTMAAGTKIETIRSYCGNYPVIRIMPNLPVSVSEGMILYCTDNVTKDEENAFLSLLSQSGMLLNIPENQIDAGCAVSGCGPAFAFMFIKALAQGGINTGLSEKDSLTLACQTVLGSAKLLMGSDMTADELTTAVCSPGGTTIEGVKHLRTENFENIASGAVDKAFKRAIELSKQ